MNLIWSTNAWEDYLYWLHNDKKTVKKINDLIKEISRSPFEGICLPEPLKHHLSGYWSRRINLEDRLAYKVEDSYIYILQCRKQY